MTRVLRVIDERIRLASLGSEIHGAVVDSVAGKVCVVRLAGGLVTAVVPALPVTLRRGMRVELERPRGIGGQLQVIRVLGQSGPAEVAEHIEAARGTTSVVTVLPTADESYRGQTLLLESTGVDDVFYRCRRKADGTFEWKIVLSA
jgi:hypothetical protein